MPTVISAATQRIINKDGNTTTVDLPRFKEHLYVHKGTFPAKLNSWEQDVLAAELSKDSLIGWYRNPTGGENALAVPYGQSENPRTLYPDFLFVHDTGDGPVIDIIDPHRPSEADTSSKWLGLAQFAQDPEHKGRFRRVLAVIKNKDGQLLSLDLTNGELPGKLRDASTEDGIRKLFDTYGGSY